MGKITPQELVHRRISELPRLGSFNPCLLGEKPPLEKLHGAPVLHLTEKPTHDRYHQIILSALPMACEKIIIKWIKTIQEKTGFNISREIWSLVDSDFTSLFMAKSNLEKLHCILKYINGIRNGDEVCIILSLIILDILK